MKRVMLLCAACALLGACDYTVPLVEKPAVALDEAVVGLWQRVGAKGKLEHLLVLPQSEYEYLVVFPSRSHNVIFARACLWQQADITLVQLTWFGSGEGAVLQESKKYQYARYKVESTALELQLLNPAVIKPEIASASALAKAIADSRDHAGLFRDKMVFTRVAKDQSR